MMKIASSRDLIGLMENQGGILELPMVGNPLYVVATGDGEIKRIKLSYEVGYGAIGDVQPSGVVDTVDGIFGEKRRRYAVARWFAVGTPEYDLRVTMNACLSLQSAKIGAAK